MPDLFPSPPSCVRRCAAALVAVSLVAGCAGSAIRSGELPVPAQRLEFDGYSFLPPNEPRWFIADRGGDYVVLARSGTYSGETLTIQSARVALPPQQATLSFVNQIRSTQVQGLTPPRFAIRAHEVTPVDVAGAACVRSRLEVEDREPNAANGPIVALLVQTASLTCKDPSRPGSGVALSYVHRSYPEDRDPGLAPRAGAVLDSLRFSPAQR